ncbi:putative F-box domain, leucine-rich repeat domain, L domain-containing protein [Rosa chinensis]|uniref:Putative F-box domain, leucine-rich repeat domain, L domain-containing protein n=1 Tax=Rosa chinensis TaxID=74649 RepID=A0A2P6QWF3_ROSCH|nr:putative F-box domain, leucine-rich repeat domain, L domain-containing protein [Rosa chinensis]
MFVGESIFFSDGFVDSLVTGLLPYWLEIPTNEDAGKTLYIFDDFPSNEAQKPFREDHQAQNTYYEMEDERRWEELEVDCLINVFARVGMESLLLDVPFVCKSWYRATLVPSCWQYLKFPDDLSDRTFSYDLKDLYWCTLIQRFIDEYRLDETRFSVTAFVKFIISRSKGKAIYLRLPPCASEDVLKYAADECPALKLLALPSRLVNRKSSIIQEIIGKWTNLEYLVLGSSYNLENFLGQISIHCKNLCLLRVADANIGKDEAMAIVSLLPKLKQLILKNAYIDRDDLVTLLRGCNELVCLDVSNCIGFDEEDEEIAKLASHIADFSSQGSTLDDYDDYDGHISHDEDVYGYGSD